MDGRLDGLPRFTSQVFDLAQVPWMGMGSSRSIVRMLKISHSTVAEPQMTSLQFIGIPHTVVLAQSPALLRPGSRQHANTAPAWLQVDPRTRCHNACRRPQGKRTVLRETVLEGCAAPPANNP